MLRTSKRRVPASLNKVPQVTAFFWVIKVLATTVGETVADLLNEKLGLGLSGTSWLMTAFLAIVLAWQFRTPRYTAGVYWLTVVLVSVVGTLVTDNLTDNLAVPLLTTTTVCAIALGAVFAVWFARERTLSIHSINTRSREAFYWLAILVTFSLGTACGDLVSERFGIGYGAALVVFGMMIALVSIALVVRRLSAVAAFWLVYILTRPLGASLGDWLAQPRVAQEDSFPGLGFGTTLVSCCFLSVIVVLVAHLALSKRDVMDES